MSIRQYDAKKLSDSLLQLYGKDVESYIRPSGILTLHEQGWRTIFNKANDWLARCYHDEKRIVINLLHLQTCSEIDLKNTILHEIAHALVGPGNGHNQIWVERAK